MTNSSEESHKEKRILKMRGEIDVEIGGRIKLLRKNMRMSLSDLGEIIGVSYQQIQKYEAGTNRISVSSLISIAGALNADPASLLAGLTAIGQEGGVDARAQLVASADSQRVNRLFAALDSEEDRALVLELAAYLTARERRRPQSVSAA
jgi:transcriptional regulator with XRE-family HTH domain